MDVAKLPFQLGKEAMKIEEDLESNLLTARRIE
jgi:hypothetical protein